MQSDRRRVVAVLAGMMGLIAGGSHTSSAQPSARDIAVASASDLQTVLPEVARRFQRDTGTVARVSFGSSGNFFAQIQNGAPFDVFLSADIEYPRQLVTGGHADAKTLYQYATGRIVLWTRSDSGIDVRRGLVVTRDARVRRIAIANPDHAPYGRAAVAALRRDKLYDEVRGKLVLGENVSQAAQFVESGNASVGIIALSLALGPALRASGTYFQILANAHPPIEQAAIVVSRSKNKAAAIQFIAYLKRPEIKQLLERFGFSAPQQSGPRPQASGPRAGLVTRPQERGLGLSRSRCRAPCVTEAYGLGPKTWPSPEARGLGPEA